MVKININKQIRFWAILGPLMTLLIFSLTLVKQSPTSFSLAILAVGGLICCLVWRMKGLLVSLAFVIAILAYNFSSVEVGERFWFLGLAMATSLSLIVTVLSHEEIEGLLRGVQRNFGKQLQLHKQESQDREKLAIDLDWLRDQKEELESKLQFYQQELTKKEDLIHQVQPQKMAEKYQVKRTPSFPSDHYEGLYKQLRDQFAEKGTLLDQTRKELFAVQEKVASMTRDYEEVTKYKRDDYCTHLEKEYMELYTELEMRDKMNRDEILELEGLVGALLERN